MITVPESILFLNKSSVVLEQFPTLLLPDAGFPVEKYRSVDKDSVEEQLPALKELLSQARTAGCQLLIVMDGVNEVRYSYISGTIGSILNPLVGKVSEDTQKKGKGMKTGASHVWRSFYLSQ